MKKNSIVTFAKRHKLYVQKPNTQVIDQYINAPDTYNKIFAAASSIRNDILNKSRWKFTSHDDYKTPTSLE